jgi:molecular chaperone DnaK
MSKIIGIDLGTTNSCVAVMEGSVPKVITNADGQRTMPSVVGFEKTGDRVVGASAKRQAVMNPTSTIYSAKRFMGAKFSDVKNELKNVAYEVVQGPNDSCVILVNGKKVTPEEVSAQILSQLKQSAEAYLGMPVTEAVITVPAYFNDAQRQATKDAGKIAGLEVKRIINEPTAAALAYGMDKSDETKVVVFDLGGGTFDVSVLEISEDVVEVVATNGDTHLGGDDVDQTIMDWMTSEFQKDSGVDVSGDKMVLQRLREAAEKAKCELSSLGEVDINLPFLTADASGPKHLVLNLSRAKFDRLIAPVIKKVMKPVKMALKDAGYTAKDIDEVLLVGGSTRIPAVREAVEKHFGKTPNVGVNPDEVVALGAAVQGGVLSGDVTDILLLDVTPLSLGIETLGGVMTTLISRNTTIPAQKNDTFSTAADGQPTVEIHVLQGERQFANDNKTLGRFHLDGIPPAPRGIPQIEVKFDIDANGIVNVSAKDKASGKEQDITITNSTGLSDKEIERMVDEAKEHEEADKTKRENIEAKNKLDSVIYQSEKVMNDHKEQIGEDKMTEVQSWIDNAKEVLASGEPDAIRTCYDQMNNDLQALGAFLYSQNADVTSEGDASYEPGPDAPHVTTDETNDGEVLDAEPVQDDDIG